MAHKFCESAVLHVISLRSPLALMMYQKFKERPVLLDDELKETFLFLVYREDGEKM